MLGYYLQELDSGRLSVLILVYIRLREVSMLQLSYLFEFEEH